MDAPLYPPAQRFEQPERLHRALSARDTAIADLKAIPAAWAVVLATMPDIERRIGSPQLKPHLGNFSLRSLVPFGVVSPDVVAVIDAGLARLEPI